MLTDELVDMAAQLKESGLEMNAALKKQSQASQRRLIEAGFERVTRLMPLARRCSTALIRLRRPTQRVYAASLGASSNAHAPRPQWRAAQQPSSF